MERFVRWYNAEHRHSALKYVTPEQRHLGRDPALLERRHEVYQRARERQPQRWSGRTRNWTPAPPVILPTYRPKNVTSRDNAQAKAA